jgi:hypothetical protein
MLKLEVLEDRTVLAPTKILAVPLPPPIQVRFRPSIIQLPAISRPRSLTEPVVHKNPVKFGKPLGEIDIIWFEELEKFRTMRRMPDEHNMMKAKFKL